MILSLEINTESVARAAFSLVSDDKKSVKSKRFLIKKFRKGKDNKFLRLTKNLYIVEERKLCAECHLIIKTQGMGYDLLFPARC